MALRRWVFRASLLAAVACSGDGGDGVQGPGEEPGGGVQVRNNLFDPADFQVSAGGTVVWTWASNGVEHNVTFEDNVTSGDQGSGTFPRTFADPGTYDSLCTLHGADMSGTITVTAPAPIDGY
jgi:plastocyanin